MDAHICCSCSKKTTLNSLIKQNKTVYVKTFYGIGLGLILVLYGLSALPENLELMLIGLLGGSPSEGELGMFEILLFILPMLIQLSLFGTVIGNDMNQSGIFIFTRMQSRKRRMTEQMLVVLSSSVLFDIFTIVPIIAVSEFAGIHIFDSFTFISLILIWFCGTVLCHVAFVLIMNVCTVRFKMVPCLMALCIVYAWGFADVVWFFKLENGLAVALYPSTQGIIGAHDIGNLAEMFPYFFTNSVPYFTIVFSAIYSSVFIAVVFAVGLRIIDKHDFLS